MKNSIAISFVCISLAAPAYAQQEEESFSLMEEGARLFMRGLMSEMEPAIEELEGMARDLEPMMRMLAQEMGPALQNLIDTIDDIRFYEPPEILDNGDIIMRRRDDAPPIGRDEDALRGTGEIDAPSGAIDL